MRRLFTEAMRSVPVAGAALLLVLVAAGVLPAEALAGSILLVGALPVHTGAGSMDLGPSASFVKREDISDLLYASLAQENTLLGLLPIGEEFVDTELRWNEDSLNIFTVKDTTAAGQNAIDTSSTLAVTAAESAKVMVGTVMYDEGETFDTGGVELVIVTDIPTTTSLTVTRGFAGTTKVTHAQNAIWRMIGPLLEENSDLGKDVSKVKIANSNVISRFGLNVNISDEQIQRALHGYSPGVPDEIDYQLTQRVREIKRQANNALIFSRRTPAAGTTPGDQSAMEGALGWLLAEAVDENAPFAPDMINKRYETVFNEGGDPEWLVLGSGLVRKVANAYSDRIRIEQDDRRRGWSVIFYDTDLAKALRIVLDPYMPAQAFALLDPRRLAIRPFTGSFLYYRTAESFRDGEAARVLSKLSLELRNAKKVTNSGAGLAHILTVRAT